MTTLYIEPWSSWETGYVERFNGNPQDKLLIGDIFYSLMEAKVLINGCRQHYNTVRPHSSLGYKPPPPPRRSSTCRRRQRKSARKS